MTINPPINITDLDHEGRGVGRLPDGRVVFVRGALPLEVVTVSSIAPRKNFCTANLAEIIHPSPHRVSPPCPHFSLCGGCSLQHLSTAEQIIVKQKWLADNLSRIGEVSPEEWRPPISPPTLAYRRRARLSVKWVEKKGRVLVGFHERGGRFIADINGCAVLAPPFNELIEPLARLVESLSIKQSIPQIEIAVGEDGNGQASAMMILRHLHDFSDDDTAALHDFYERTQVSIYGLDNRKQTRLIAPNHHESAYTVEGLRLYFSPADFVQINAEGNRAMVRQAIDWLDLHPQDTVLDAFCGLGNFSLPIAQKLVSHSTMINPADTNHEPLMWGIEGSAELIARAQNNAERNDLAPSINFSVDNLFEPSAATLQILSRVNKLLIDPPRDGAQALSSLMPPSIERIVYVSCHPATLARDAKILVQDKGFRLVCAGVVDMFSHTNHVESMALFVR